MQRPEPIKLTAALMALKLSIGIVLTTIQPPWNAANFHPKNHAALHVMVHGMQIVYASFLVVAFLAIRGYWIGKFWARRAVILASLFYLYQIVHLGNVWRHSHARGIMTLYASVLALNLLWYLFTREAEDWFPWPTDTNKAGRYRSFVIDK